MVMQDVTQDEGRDAALIGLDWGSTGLRAWLIGAGGSVLSARQAPLGASVLSGDAAYAQALEQLTGDWQRARPELPLLACGMVGSQHGWREVPYLNCPADAAMLAAQMSSQMPAGAGGLRIVPGLLDEPHDGTPDVMRGEETQILGAVALHPDLADATLILPGTHSKWARLRQGHVLGFATQMTGELFALLREHSVLGRLMVDTGGEPDWNAFDEGVAAAREQGTAEGLLHQLFGVRALGLRQRLPNTGAADYLSGLLIGHELVVGVATLLPVQPLALVGDAALCHRYVEALKQFGVHDVKTLENTAPAGLWRLARELALA
ncbi:2-dehydro-3-deoxygalactonokinase [Paucibacter sp. R3-3]|uniref:2-dehydro-3-deoxygalactonokinase n=1 Tax=Roseateles agri TaxID=3098619 RepID=A0ABU5DLH1_9BURK|nr:2-dehydro-3-deoxygalactonokinase [Paucibacter sp. R3-3]MDY0746994.1 2-dehydro-3-deoxygalactonokinase [Paucibacter sp. R3-3]